MSQKTIARLERLQQLNSNRQWTNHDLYRLMYQEDLYIIAYERIKSQPGNMTPGTDEETLDGFSLASIREIIQEMKTEQFRFRPVRQQFIPKPNGKMRKLGIPTANIKVENELLPKTGVYVTAVRFGDERQPSVTNVGYRPTVGGSALTVESHLLDFAGDLYGRRIEVEFLRKLRDERRFSSIDELKAAISADIKSARQFWNLS